MLYYSLKENTNSNFALEVKVELKEECILSCPLNHFSFNFIYICPRKQDKSIYFHTQSHNNYKKYSFLFKGPATKYYFLRRGYYSVHVCLTKVVFNRLYNFHNKNMEPLDFLF